MGWWAGPQRKARARPYISFSPSVLQLLLEHQDWIAPDHRDPLHELLEDLGELPTVRDLIGACHPSQLGLWGEPAGRDRQAGEQGM